MLNDLDMESIEDLMIYKPVNIMDYKVKQFWKYGFPVIKVIWRNYDIEKATWQIGEKMKTRISVFVWGYR